MKSNFLRAVFISTSILALTGCGEEEQAVKTYTTVDTCTADIAADATGEEREKITKDCQDAFSKSQVEHEKVVTHYEVIDRCTALYEQCVPASNGNGFVPFMTGFMLGYVGGSPVYHPYYYDRYHVVYSGGARLGYYRSGYVVAPPNAAWTNSYNRVTINKGAPPPPATSTRGGFGGSAGFSAGRASPRSVVSNPVSPSGRGSSSVSTPSAPSARGGFGASSGVASSSSGG